MYIHLTKGVRDLKTCLKNYRRIRNEDPKSRSTDSNKQSGVLETKATRKTRNN